MSIYDPIVLFLKEGRKKEVKLFEVDKRGLIPVDAPNAPQTKADES